MNRQNANSRHAAAPGSPPRVHPSVAVDALDRLRAQLDQFRSSGYVHAPGLLSARHAEAMERRARPLPGRRVACGRPDVTWEEQGVADDHEVHRFFSHAALVHALAHLLETPGEGHSLTCWVSRYRRSEYISRHTDRAGTVQIVLSLSVTAGVPGGALMLVLPQGEVQLHLRPGDAVIFRASSIPHFTSPLTATSSCPDPMRAVAVARYFFGADAGT